MSYHTLVENQREFFRTGESANLNHRRAQLKKLRQVILDNQEVFGDAVYKDLKRNPKTNYFLELAQVVVEIDYMLENLENWAAPTTAERTFVTMLDTPQIVREPKGVVLVIGPWNYPLNTLLTPLVAVLAAGNTAILKPSEHASHTAAVVDSVFSKAFDNRYLAVVQAGVPETTELLKERFDHVVFTGSTRVGQIVMEAAAKHLSPCTLELGGKSPVIIEPDSDLTITARRLAWGKWLNCGQTCLAPDYVLTTKAVKIKLLDELKRVIEEFYGEIPAKNPDYSRIINRANFDRLANLMKETRGTILYKGGEFDADDLFVPPIILDVQIDDPLMQTEIFGPILPIVTMASFDEAIWHIKTGEKPLAAYLFTRDENKVNRLINETASGSVCVNDVIMQITVDTIPFGGIGNSGMGRYRGKFGFDEFTHEKAVLKRMFFGEGLASARYPPLTDEKLKGLQQLTGKRRAFPRFLKAVVPTVPYLLMGFLFGLLCNRLFKFQ